MMVLSYILLITLGTIYPYLKIDFILNHRFIVIIGQLIAKFQKVLKRKKVNGIIISSLNPICLSESIFKSQFICIIYKLRLEFRWQASGHFRNNSKLMIIYGIFLTIPAIGIVLMTGKELIKHNTL